MKHSVCLAVLGVCVQVLSGCSGESNAQSPSPESQFVQLNQGLRTENAVPTKTQTKVISTQADYAAELVNYTSATPASVDFTKGKILLVDMGPRPSSGYSIGVASVDVADAWVVANVELVKPGGPMCGVLTVETNPWQFVFIPTLKEILLSEKVVVHSC